MSGVTVAICTSKLSRPPGLSPSCVRLVTNTARSLTTPGKTPISLAWRINLSGTSSWTRAFQASSGTPQPQRHPSVSLTRASYTQRQWRTSSKCVMTTMADLTLFLQRSVVLPSMSRRNPPTSQIVGRAWATLRCVKPGQHLSSM